MHRMSIFLSSILLEQSLENEAPRRRHQKPKEMASDGFTDSKVNKLSGLQNVIDTELFRERFVQSTERQHQLGLALGDGTMTTKLEEIIRKGEDGRPQTGDE